jgi:hypothetical protein
MLSDNLLLAGAFLVSLVIVAGAMLSGWQGWLELKRRELDTRRPHEIEGGVGEGAARIEMADLKERIRKLEAIASGVDL